MNIKIYLYNKEDRKFSHIMGGHAFLVTEYIDEYLDYTLTPPPDYNHVWRWIDAEWVADPTEEKSIAEAQASVWSNIKDKRQDQITSGVLVKSVDKVFQTDNNSIIQYSNIGGMIALNNYEPIQWKTEDNSWVTLTEDLFKELQQAMSANTQSNYATAEQHKEAMLAVEDPLNYDYSKGWSNGVVDYN